MNAKSLPFASIKILNDSTTISPAVIDDTDDNSWNFGDIKTDKPASTDMQEAMQSFVPEVAKRLLELTWLLQYIDVEKHGEITAKILEKITIQGLTISYKDGNMGIKIHFRITNTMFYKSPFNAHLPTIFEYAEDITALDPDDQKGYLTDAMVANAQRLCEATEEYLRFQPKDDQLALFAGDAYAPTEMVAEAEQEPPTPDDSTSESRDEQAEKQPEDDLPFGDEEEDLV